MNNRIKELFKSIRKSKHTSNLMSNPPQVRYSYTIDEEDINKFAQLLVKECISCVGSQADKAYLKKHFGLPVESDIIYPAVEESWSVETQYKRNVLL